MWPLALRYAPYIIGACVTGIVVYVIYTAGYNNCEREWELKWERHQGALMQANAERTSKALQAMADRHRQQDQIGQRFSEIEIPDTDSCTDPEWLRTHNDTVRAANGAP